MREIMKQILAKDKARTVIYSCENCFHYDTAERYIERYKIVFGDMVGGVELANDLKKVKLKNLGDEKNEN